jgi:hypothetical protein
MSDTKPAKPTVLSQQYRRFAADTFSMRINDSIAQLSFALETADEKENEIIMREATAVMTPRSLKVMHLLTGLLIQNVEGKFGKIELPPGKEEQLASLMEFVKKWVAQSTFFQRASAAFFATADRSFAVIFSARAFPPRRPSDCAALSLPSSVTASSSSPVAIRITFTAFPITSAGRLRPLGSLGISAIPACLSQIDRARSSAIPNPAAVASIFKGSCLLLPIDVNLHRDGPELSVGDGLTHGISFPH